jgi:Cu2+-exporting ATPase
MAPFDVALPGAVQVHLVDDAGWLATFSLQEDVRADAGQAVQALQQAGCALRLVSGDAEPAVARVAAEVGIADFSAACTPADKLEILRRAQADGRRVAVVGDGLNDGPVLAGAHVSFAFGQAVPLAQARSDFIVLGEQLQAVAQTLLLARQTVRVVRQNLLWAAGYNALCVPLAVMGWLPAWLAGLGMGLSSLIVIVNALRLARWRGPLAAV